MDSTFIALSKNILFDKPDSASTVDGNRSCPNSCLDTNLELKLRFKLTYGKLTPYATS